MNNDPVSFLLCRVLNICHICYKINLCRFIRLKGNSHVWTSVQNVCTFEYRLYHTIQNSQYDVKMHCIFLHVPIMCSYKGGGASQWISVGNENSSKSAASTHLVMSFPLTFFYLLIMASVLSKAGICVWHVLDGFGQIVLSHLRVDHSRYRNPL